MRRKQLGRHTKEMLRVTCRKVQGFKYTADEGLAQKKKSVAQGKQFRRV